MADNNDLPNDWKDPQWSEAGRVHEWKNYISDELKVIWPTFTDMQKKAIAISAALSAARENWD